MGLGEGLLELPISLNCKQQQFYTLSVNSVNLRKERKPIQLSVLNELRSGLEKHVGLKSFCILVLLLRNTSDSVLLNPIE